MYKRTSSTLLLLGVVIAGAACADSPAAPSPELAVQEDAETRQFARRLVELRADRDRPRASRDNFARFQSLVRDIQEWNRRTGSFSYIANTAECDPKLTASNAPTSGGGPWLPYCGCPQIPLGTPIGYRCWLVDWACDENGRMCIYQCQRVYLGWPSYGLSD